MRKSGRQMCNVRSAIAPHLLQATLFDRAFEAVASFLPCRPRDKEE